MLKWIDNSNSYYKILEDHNTGVFYLVAEGRGAHGGGVAIIPMVDQNGEPRTCKKLDSQKPIIESVANYSGYDIVRDIHTGVLYLVAEGRGAHGGGVAITVMIDQNGDPCIYDENSHY